MKNIQLISLSILVFSAFSLMAQNPIPSNPSSKAAPSGTAVADNPMPYCDVVIPQTVEKLQQIAESTCKTATACVPCLDRATNTELYATMYAQPNSPSCKAVTNIAYEAQPTNKEELQLAFEILQSPCTKDGVNLSLSFPDGSIVPANYTFSWEVDGKRVGQGQQLSCVCGQTAKITITEKASRRTKSKTMRLQNACGGSKN